ncbi:MAG: hypothetical protein II208_00995 [Alphaproteobacteria bacterium]|nr:hypothetical protein [Alphaproteobacteria bacterium]
MKSEQLKWTDKQWAAHMGCAVQHVPNIRKYVLDNYFVGVGQFRDTGKYSCELYRLDYAPSGYARFHSVTSTNQSFETADAATKFANETFIPELKLLPMVAKIANVPVCALQMLHVKEKQK